MWVLQMTMLSLQPRQEGRQETTTVVVRRHKHRIQCLAVLTTPLFLLRHHRQLLLPPARQTSDGLSTIPWSLVIMEMVDRGRILNVDDRRRYHRDVARNPLVHLRQDRKSVTRLLVLEKDRKSVV